MALIQGVPQDKAGGTTGARSSVPGASNWAPSPPGQPVAWTRRQEMPAAPWPLARQADPSRRRSLPADDDHTNIEEDNRTAASAWIRRTVRHQPR